MYQINVVPDCYVEYFLLFCCVVYMFIYRDIKSV